MAANIIDYIVSFVILTGLLAFTITATTGNLDNLYVYHAGQELNTAATNLLNDLTGSTGSPPDWAQRTVSPTSLGFGWAIGEGSYLSPFVPMRLMGSSIEQSYSSTTYGDLSTSSMSSWPSANLFFKTQDSLTYDQASKLLNINSTNAWRVTYTPVYQIEIATTTPSIIPWYTGWGYRMAMTLNHTKVSAGMTNYPILIKITQPSLGLNTQPDGADILFTTSDKLTKIPHEIDSYDSNTGQLSAWVRVPQLSNTIDTVIYMYYGNPTAVDQESSSQVWSGYTSVYHMNDNPDSTHIKDSSSNGLSGTKAADHQPAEVSNGVISFAQSFDGSNDYVTLSQATLSSGSDVYEMWLKSFRASTPQTILSSGFRNNTVGFIDVSRPPQGDTSSGDDLVFDYAANSGWVQSAGATGASVTCLASFKSNIYAGASDGKFYKWDGVSAWVAMPSLPGSETFASLAVFNNKLYAGSNGGGKLYEWDVGYSGWVLKAPTLKIKSLVLNPSDLKIYGGTDDGRLLRWNTGTNVWDVVAIKLGSETSINCLTIYSNSIYAGTSPGGKLYKWDGSNSWILIATPPGSNTFTDVNSLAVYNGKLYAGTNPGGYLMSWTSGSSWVLEKTTGETSIDSLNAISSSSYTESFGYAAGGSSGGFSPTDNMRLSDNQYASHSVTALLRSPTSYSGNWQNPSRALAEDSNYASTSTSGRAETYSTYGFSLNTQSIVSVKVKINAWRSSTNERLIISVYKSGWLSQTYTIANLTSSKHTFWVDVTSWGSSDWTPTDVNAIQVKVQSSLSSGSVNLDYVGVQVLYSTSSPTQTFSNFNINPTGDMISKVEVGVEGNSNPASIKLTISVSSDNGNTWSTPQTSQPLTTSDTTQYLDFTGSGWTLSQLGNGKFEVKIVDGSLAGTTSQTNLDYVFVRITTTSSKMFASTSPHTYTWILSQTNTWTEIINTQYSGESTISSLVYLGGTLYGCTLPSGILVKQGTGGSSNTWVLVASPPVSQKITTLLTDGTTIFGGTTPSGLLYKLTGSSWSQVASTQYGAETTITSLAFDSANTNVLAGTDMSALLLAVPKTGGSWTKKADITIGAGDTKIPSMAVYNNKLYLGTYPHGLLFEWDGTSAWVQKAPQYTSQTSINSLAVFNDILYGGTTPGSLLKWAMGDTAWTQVAPPYGSETVINALANYDNGLYGSTSPGGRLLKWDSVNKVWVGETYILGAETSISSLAVYNGKLFGGTSPSGLLYEWDGATKWVKMANALNGQTNIPALTVFNNQLYGVTGAGGYLFVCSDSGARVVPNFFAGYSDKWMHVTMIINFAQKRIDLYRNGTLLGTPLSTGNIVTQLKTPRYLGAYVVAGEPYNAYSGYIDELRVSQLAITQAWITLCYNNQGLPSSFIKMSPEESILFKVKVMVTSKNGVVGDASCTGTILYCLPGATTPSYAQLTSQTETTDVNGQATIVFNGYTSDHPVYFIMIRVSHAGVSGTSYYLNSPSQDPLGVFVSDYTNGVLTLAHRKDFVSTYSNMDIVGYNATFALPIGTSSYRLVALNSAGVIAPGSPTSLQLGVAKESPGVLLVFYKTAAGTYGVTYTPWGISALGLEATFGSSSKDATNVITKTRVVNIESITYEIKLEFWSKGGY